MTNTELGLILIGIAVILLIVKLILKVKDGRKQ